MTVMVTPTMRPARTPVAIRTMTLRKRIRPPPESCPCNGLSLIATPALPSRTGVPHSNRLVFNLGGGFEDELEGHKLGMTEDVWHFQIALHFSALCAKRVTNGCGLVET